MHAKPLKIVKKALLYNEKGDHLNPAYGNM